MTATGQDGAEPTTDSRDPGRQRADAVRSRERILAAAASRFAPGERASLSKIASAAGVGRTTLYRHFPTRASLVEALAERAQAERTRALEESLTPPLVTADGPALAEPTPKPAKAELGPAAAPSNAPAPIEARHVLDEVPPHLLGDQLVAEAQRVGRVPVALYLVDIDGSYLLRLAGSEEFPARLASDLSPSLALGPEIAPEGLEELRALLAAELPGSTLEPLWLRGRALGVLLAVGTPHASLAEIAREGAAALELASAYTDAFAAARRRRLPSPAAELQQELLPPRISRIAGGELAGGVLPGYDVGGDWFDFVENRDGAWLAIADTTGKGGRAAAFGALALAALRASRRQAQSLPEAVWGMNRAIAAAGQSEVSVSAIIARWNAVGATLRWVACGHAPPLLLPSDGPPEELPSAQHAEIGALADADELRPDERQLRRGDRVVLYSDGVTERRRADGGLFGLPGLRATLAAAAGASAPRTARLLQQAVLSASDDDLEDDAALVVLALV